MRLVVALAIAVAIQSPQFKTAKAEEWVRASRNAVAAGRSINDLRALTLKGRVRLPGEGDIPADGTTEIKVLLPDRFVRVDTVGGVERRPASDRIALLRLLLGLGAIVPAGQAVTFESVDESAFPDTRNLDVASGSWSARLVVDLESHVPLRVVDWAGPRGATVMSFADRRNVDGFLVPHRMTTTTAERVLESLMIDEARVNPPLTDADFRK